MTESYPFCATDPTRRIPSGEIDWPSNAIPVKRGGLAGTSGILAFHKADISSLSLYEVERKSNSRNRQRENFTSIIKPQLDCRESIQRETISGCSFVINRSGLGSWTQPRAVSSVIRSLVLRPSTSRLVQAGAGSSRPTSAYVSRRQNRTVCTSLLTHLAPLPIETSGLAH